MPQELTFAFLFQSTIKGHSDTTSETRHGLT